MLQASTVRTVAVYTQVGIKALKDLHQAMHPAAALPGRTVPDGDGGHDTPEADVLLDALDEEGEDEDAP